MFTSTILTLAVLVFPGEKFEQGSSWCGSRITAEDIASADRLGGDCTLSYTNPDPMWDPTNGMHIIPVVFHVIQAESGTGYLSPERVQNQVDALNNQFQSLLGEASVDVQVSFVLASESPTGDATDGINYYSNDAFFNDGDGSFAYSIGWDQQRYLNIYTFNLLPSGPLGYAYYPFSAAGQWWDGVYLDYHVVGGPGDADAPWTDYDGGDVCTHEAGHYFGLHHTFETDLGACDSSGCDSSGDTVCDTNPHSVSDYYCSSSNTCGSASPIRNYMNYTLPSCMYEFTPIQANRIRCVLANYRSSLPLTDGACCWSGNCLSGPQSACDNVGGVFHGIGSNCINVDCTECTDTCDPTCDVYDPCVCDPDSCSGGCPADITGDWLVNVQDLLIIIDVWGSDNPIGDLNDDGIVSVQDLLIIIDAWGECALPEGAVQWPVADGGNDHWYIIDWATSPPLSWSDITGQADALGGYLATILSLEENDFVINLMESAGTTEGWFGLTAAEGSDIWEWVTGEPVDFTSWGGSDCGAGPYPNDGSSTVRFALFTNRYFDCGWVWDDFNEYHPLNFPVIIEWD